MVLGARSQAIDPGDEVIGILPSVHVGTVPGQIDRTGGGVRVDVIDVGIGLIIPGAQQYPPGGRDLQRYIDVGAAPITAERYYTDRQGSGSGADNRPQHRWRNLGRQQDQGEKG